MAASEAELGSLARAGDVQTLGALLERCRPSLYATAVGMLGNRAQDSAVCESMGPVADRTREHLGTTDAAIILLRRYLVRKARELQNGKLNAQILDSAQVFEAPASPASAIGAVDEDLYQHAE